MNVNEVVSYVANEYLKEHNSDETIHPNDDEINHKALMIHSQQQCTLLYIMKLKQN